MVIRRRKRVNYNWKQAIPVSIPLGNTETGKVKYEEWDEVREFQFPLVRQRPSGFSPNFYAAYDYNVSIPLGKAETYGGNNYVERNRISIPLGKAETTVNSLFLIIYHKNSSLSTPIFLSMNF